MKNRCYFVSNSSSTSFIILYDKSNVANADGFSLTVDKFLNSIDIFSSHYSDETEIISFDKKEIIDRLENYEYADEVDKEIVEKLKQSSKNAAYFSISNHHSILKDLFNFLKYHNVIEVIDERDV